MTTGAVSIAVLAGGSSRRLGSDKALATLTDGGPPLLRIVLDRVRPLSDDLFVVSPPRPGYERFGVPVVPDRFPETGPLGGIASALRHAREERCLVLPCDHPFLNPALLRAMIATPGDWDALVPVLPGESRQGEGAVRQTLHAIYRKSCLPAIERRVREARLQVAGLFDEVRAKELDVEWLRVHDPELRSFFSMNTQESLATAKRWSAGANAT
jgi:molybdopterin-guanine dinucleotide biosynthesis protein A